MVSDVEGRLMSGLIGIGANGTVGGRVDSPPELVDENWWDGTYTCTKSNAVAIDISILYGSYL